MEKIKIELTEHELEIVYAGLLELVGKVSLPVIHGIDVQIKNQQKKPIKDVKDGNKSEV